MVARIGTFSYRDALYGSSSCIKNSLNVLTSVALATQAPTPGDMPLMINKLVVYAMAKLVW